MKCPHCGLAISTILGAPENAKCYLAFCSGCSGVVKVEDNKLKVLSSMDKVAYKIIQQQRVERHMCN